FDVGIIFYIIASCLFFFFSSRRPHTRSKRDWSSDVCSSDLHLDCAPVNEHVLVFAFEGDESVALFSVEPLDGTLCHYFSIQCSAIDIPHLSRDQATASG